MLDIDGTMIPGSLGLGLLARLRSWGLGAPEHIDAIFAEIERQRGGAISYNDMVAETTRRFAAAIRGISTSSVDEVAAEVWAERRADLFPFVRPMVARLLASGLRPVIISSSPRAIVRHLAADLGVDDVAGSLFRVDDGRYDGTCELMPGRPQGKVTALQRTLCVDTLAALDLPGSLALGNALSDACVLEIVGAPIAFEPVPELRELAAARGWTISDRARLLDDLDRLLG
ncbi:MAG: haloacid dehalogenase-like hydrolase [Nannocystaceae bacterium]